MVGVGIIIMDYFFDGRGLLGFDDLDGLFTFWVVEGLVILVEELEGEGVGSEAGEGYGEGSVYRGAVYLWF